MKQAPACGGAKRLGMAFVRNFPVALLFCASYFVFFSYVWGPLATWKLAAALAILIGLSLTLRVRYPRGEARKKRRRKGPGAHEAAARAEWPVWRRIAAVVTGSALCFAGIYQCLGTEVNVGDYPLISGLCLMVSLGVGVTFVAWGWPRPRWRRKHPRLHQSALKRRIGSGGYSTLQLPVPRDSGLSGVWGGFGTRPADKIWKPGGSRPAAEPEPVPARFRHVKLLRRGRSRATRAPSWTLALLLVFGACLLAAFLYLLSGR